MTLDKIDKSNKSFNNTKSIAVIFQRMGFQSVLIEWQGHLSPLMMVLRKYFDNKPLYFDLVLWLDTWPNLHYVINHQSSFGYLS